MSQPKSGYVAIKVSLSPEVKKRLIEMAARRYPRDDEAQDKVINDALKWHVDRMERLGPSPHEYFWLYMIHIPLLNRLAWGKLIEPYFE